MSETLTLQAQTLTKSYARPLADLLAEQVHVIDFVPSDTPLSGVSDWGVPWNAALNEARAMVAAGKTFSLVGPDIPQEVFSQVNGTAIQSFGSRIDFGNSLIVCATTGLTTFDFMGTWFLTFDNLRYQGGIGGPMANTQNIPLIGFQWGRAIPNSNADTNTFRGIFANGSFGLSAAYCNAAESNLIANGWISNNVDNKRMTGIPTVRGKPTNGAPVAYALICDSASHWQVPTLHPSGNQFKQDQGVSFEQFIVRNSTITCGSGSAMWISGGTNHAFDDIYMNCGSPDALVDWFRGDDDAPNNFRFHLHGETASAAGYKSLFRFLGNVDSFASYCDGLEVDDGGIVFDNQLFEHALAQPVPVALTNCTIRISNATNNTGAQTSGKVFSDPTLFRTQGSIAVPTATWNGIDDAGAGCGHTGELVLYNPNGSTTVARVGMETYRAKLAASSVEAALATLGLGVVTRGVQSVTMVNGGNFYTAMGQGTAFTPTVSFPQPPGGVAATGVPVIAINGLGLASGAKGTGYQPSQSLQCIDADGHPLPFSVRITTDGSGGIQDVWANNPAPLATIPSGPYTVQQQGASGGQLYADVTVIGVTMTNPGSGYEAYPGVVAPNFSGGGTSGIAVMAPALLSAGLVRVVSTPVAGLPTATAALEGTTAAVTDAVLSTRGSAPVGGGSNHVPVYCNGSGWTVL